MWMDATVGYSHIGSATRKNRMCKRNQGNATWSRKLQGSKNHEPQSPLRTGTPDLHPCLLAPPWSFQLSPISAPLCGSDSFRMALSSPRLQCSEWQDALTTAFQGLELGLSLQNSSHLPQTQSTKGSGGTSSPFSALGACFVPCQCHMSAQTERLILSPHPQWVLGIRNCGF